MKERRLRQIAVRVPDATYRKLKALVALSETSQADVLTRAVDDLFASLSPVDRRLAKALANRSRQLATERR
jgi:hypothetical protein